MEKEVRIILVVMCVVSFLLVAAMKVHRQTLHATHAVHYPVHALLGTQQAYRTNLSDLS